MSNNLKGCFALCLNWIQHWLGNFLEISKSLGCRKPDSKFSYRLNKCKRRKGSEKVVPLWSVILHKIIQTLRALLTNPFLNRRKTFSAIVWLNTFFFNKSLYWHFTVDLIGFKLIKPLFSEKFPEKYYFRFCIPTTN